MHGDAALNTCQAGPLCVGSGTYSPIMGAVFILILGVVVGGAMNVAVQLFLDRLARRRACRLGARVLYSELMELGFVEINLESGVGPSNALQVHAAWREHRASLIDLGEEVWRAVEEAVMEALYPELPRRFPGGSHNAALEVAVGLLERHAALPPKMRAFV